MIPSESFILKQRLFTFFDEWLFYGLLIGLILTGHTYMAIPVAIIGSIAMVFSYARLWAMEAARAEATNEY